jgi:hypothetical protein
MEMSFTKENGKKVVLRDLIRNTPRAVKTKCMEAIFRREDTVYVAECRILVWMDKKGDTHYSLEIQRIIDRHNKVFEPIPPGAPLDRGFEHII